MLCRRARKL
ncbi:hypothetical protein CCR75_004909 [Bremia lactucae]|uniref:Uncharacterized protein n=1 Tax=Bremia lactucae TaxID=4779 RepID=A0A976FGN9_BRELC|nr:hypothetical protein CCR75_004909 [Bremia lactucae]